MPLETVPERVRNGLGKVSEPIGTDARAFRDVSLRDRRNAWATWYLLFTRSGADFVTSAALSQSQAQISLQTALSQGQVQIS